MLFNISLFATWLAGLADTHTHPFNGPFSRTARVSRYQKGKTILILLKQETVSGIGFSWAICKSAPHSRQIAMPAPNHSVFLQVGCPSYRPSKALKEISRIDFKNCRRFLRDKSYNIKMQLKFVMSINEHVMMSSDQRDANPMRSQ